MWTCGHDGATTGVQPNIGQLARQAFCRIGMKINSAEFVKSSTRISQCPEPNLPEYAFIGRSNVGKSSLINMMVSKKNLAKTSGKPGKTTLINHYLINGEESETQKGWYLVDLPGYGYAARSKSERGKWLDFTQNYLRHRENLMCLFTLIDSRHEAQKIDLDFITWLGTEGIPFVLVFTKADKLNTSQLNKNLEAYKKVLMESWEELPQIFVTSSELKQGREELIEFVDNTNSLWNPET
jgi:GTP-binding protein